MSKMSKASNDSLVLQSRMRNLCRNFLKHILFSIAIFNLHDVISNLVKYGFEMRRDKNT